MPLRILLSITLLLVQPAHCQWGDFNTEKILSHVNTIVLADFQSSHREGDYKKGVFKIKEILKGRRATVGEVVTMIDTHDLVTGPVVDFEKLAKGRYLILIYYFGVSKDDKKTIACAPANGTSSVLPVIGEKVPWPRKFTRRAKEFPTNLNEVRKQIGGVAKAEAEAYAKGVAKAKAELKKGELNYPLRSGIHSMAADSNLASKVKKKYGITVSLLTNMLYETAAREEHAGYQNTISAHLKKKFGFDPVQKLLRPFG